LHQKLCQQRHGDSTMKIKFTDSFIKSLKATGKPYSHGDTEHKGLMVRVSATGTKTFALAYHSKADQKTRFLTFGQYGDITVADAFAAHAKARAALASGEDPQAAKVEERALKKSAITVAELIAEFVAGPLGGKRSARDSTRRLIRVCTAFGWMKRDANTITEDEAHDCLSRLAAHGGHVNEKGKAIGGAVESFASKSLLHSMWKWARKPPHKHVIGNIFRDLEVDAAELPDERERVLTPDEIRTLWSETENPYAFGFTADTATALRLILTTMARPGMVISMARGELVDLDQPQPKPMRWGPIREVPDENAGNGPIWVLAHERMKRKDKKGASREPFIVPLNAMAVDLINRSNGGRDGRVLGAGQLRSTAQRMRHDDPGALMRAIWAKHGFPHAYPHDLRRTAATLVESAVLPDRPKWQEHEVGWLLSHSTRSGGNATKRYTRYQHFDEKRAMAATLERELRRILAAKPAMVRTAA
jgi:integrase